MAINDISLTSGMRSNLVSLQSTVNLLNRTQDRLSSGKKVNSPLDNAASYFAAKALTDRASDLNALKDEMGQAIQAIKVADSGIKAITSLIEAAKGIAASAFTSSDTAALETQFDGVLTQIDTIVTDATYKGANLLDGVADLTVNFNEDGTSSLDITSTDSTYGNLGISAADFSDATAINAAIDELNTALGTLRATASGLSGNLGIITTRQEFTTNMVNTLTGGADSLTLADMNEEGANMLMLQTRQALGTTALSLSAQAAQSVLRLF